MSFIDTLVESREGKFSAYFQFMSGRGREGFDLYAFVEDTDDIAFYQHALPHTTEICFLGCGGKSAVLEIYERISREQLLDECLFMVDRDTEYPPFENETEVLRTAGYSWESHALEQFAVEGFVRRKLIPMPATQVVNSAMDSWAITSQNFRHPLAQQAAIMAYANASGKKANVSGLAIVRNAEQEGLKIRPSPAVLSEISAVNQVIVSSAHDNVQYEKEYERFISYEGLTSFRGKTAFQVFKEFISILLEYYSKICIVQHNSPKDVVLCIPPDHPCFDYIREYVARKTS